MGFIKNRQTEREDKHLSDYIPDKSLCSDHIQNYTIKRFIKNKSTKGYCNYCNQSKKVISLESLLEFMMIGITNFYGDAANILYYETREGGYLGEVFTTYDLINDQIGIEVDLSVLSDDIVNGIADVNWVDKEIYYDSESASRMYHWNFFKEVVKHKSRYLFSKSKIFSTTDYNQQAYEILNIIGKEIIKFKLIRILPKGIKIYRCRQHDNTIVISQSRQISSPPTNSVIYSNRMSPAGISMFYGAFNETTAEKETINNENKSCRFLATAIFKIKSDIKIIDLTHIPELPDFFDSKRFKKYHAIKFLHSFVSDLSGNIIRDGMEHIEYIPSQVFTEYLRFPFNENKHFQIDGIMYPSSKDNGKTAIVLFYDNDQCEEKLTFLSSELKNKKLKKIVSTR